MPPRLAVAQRGLILPGQVRPLLPSQFVVPNGLVGYWGLSPDCLDFHQGLAFDISGNGNHGTLNNLPATAIANGPVGGALTFNGTSGYINFSPSSAVALAFNSQTLTICSWNNPSAVNIIQNVITKSFSSGHEQFGILLNSTAIAIQGSTGNGATAFIAIAGKQQFIGAVIGASGVTGNSALYYDGALVATATAGTYTYNPAFGVSIGCSLFTGGPSRYFGGSLGEIRIYNRALDPWEIQAIYQAGLAGRRDAILRPQLSDLTAAGMGSGHAPGNDNEFIIKWRRRGRR